MNLSILSYDFDPPIGGMGVLARVYAESLKSLSSEMNIEVFSPSQHADDHGGKLGSFRFGKPGGCPLFSIAMLFRLPSLLRKYRTDVLHVHAGSGGVFILKKPECTILVTSHHTYRQEAQYVYSGFRRLSKLAMSFLERRTYRLADHICCVSEDTKEELILHYRVPSEKITVIENPVSTEVPMEGGEGSAAGTIVCVGRLERRKGTMTLLHAFKEVVKTHPQAKLRLIGRNLTGQEISEYLSVNGLSQSVTLEGHLSNPERFRAMASADAVVVPSLLEGFGLVAAEAMTMGCLTIVSDGPGLRSLIRDGETGYVFRAGNSDDLTRVLLGVLSSRKASESIKAAAKEEARRRFDASVQSKKLLESLLKLQKEQNSCT